MTSPNTRRNLRFAAKASAAGALTAGLLATMLAPAQAAETPAPSYSQQVLASNGDNAISSSLAPFYRIPALADLGNGVLLASYDGRPDGGDSPSANSIVQRRSIDNGKTWGAPTFIARGQLAATGTFRYGFSDPSYVVDRETGTIFNFHVYSKDTGFAASAWGNDDADRQVVSAEVSVSTDDGLTWSTDPANQPTLPTPVSYPAGSPYAGFDGPLVTDVVKPVGTTVNGVANVGGVKGVFAASGEGIQLKYGAYKGRLVQQFTGVVRQADGSTPYQSYSVYSDDHGKTWQRGAYVGTGMDENKTVELSNGDVMLNSRDSAGSKGRKVAISKDGGATYGPVTVNATLADPTNNASITRMYPDAAQGSAKAKMLLFSNANSTSSRSNGTIRYSCDDGTTWSAGKQFKSGTMSYSTVTALSDGTFGLLYEGDNNTITYGAFNAEWLDVYCGASVSAAAITGANGATVNAELTVSNTGESALEGATATFTELPGWTFGSTTVPSIPAGGSVVVQVPVTIPSYAKAGTANIAAKVVAGTRSVSAPAKVTITGGSTETIVGADIKGERNDAGRDLATSPYAAGEALPYKFTVTSTGNITESVVPQTGAFKPFVPADGGGNCRFSTLAVWAGYVCSTPKHTVTADEVAQGFFTPVTTWQVTGTGATTQNYTITGGEVDLMVRNPALAGTAAAVWNDVDGDGYATPGDTITYSYAVQNNGNVPLTGLAAPGLGLDPMALAVGASATATTTYALTAADLAAAQVPGTVVQASAQNGAKTATADLVANAVALRVLPAKPGTDPDLSKENLKGAPPVDLGLGTAKYSVGDTVTIHNVVYGQWYYVYLNQHSARIGWFQAEKNNTVTFVLPAGTKNGMDNLVVRDAAGNRLSWGSFQVTPAK
ncbi:exo-alpha-sialidase [Arthrobacter sp. 35W]|uniref:exo-alpha-sialidase n=1 Tax=Arthrobacter sp. 35W TaxID=1132441 RepID=UPI00047B5749|nr:exo-alpha-sialidase [Arthrobacter sp. 35W]